MRPNFFVNTQDILTEYLQHGGPPAFRVRAVLAATMSPTWGVYSGYELCENVPLVPGSEEYLASEKYQYRPRASHPPPTNRPPPRRGPLPASDAPARGASAGGGAGAATKAEHEATSGRGRQERGGGVGGAPPPGANTRAHSDQGDRSGDPAQAGAIRRHRPAAACVPARRGRRAQRAGAGLLLVRPAARPEVVPARGLLRGAGPRLPRLER